ncbi:carbamate kinase [Haloarculaceae archaeon H-GB11]|nr:carbamate kinase [Haloarculaceae archaeon H-GB11]
MPEDDPAHESIDAKPQFDLDVQPPEFWGTPRERPLCMVALGGNAIVPPGTDGTYEEQMAAVAETAEQIVAVMKAGYKVVLTHGNGPQVGALLLQQAQGEPPSQPLDVCGAMSQGQIGYMLAQQVTAALEQQWKHVPVACLLTQTVVDPDDPALDDPTKPVGPFVDESQAERMLADGQSVTKVRDTGDRDYRRVVPSPEPMGVVEEAPIKRLVDQRDLVICGGGGGVPVSRAHGEIRGHEAVVDKDLLTQVLGHRLDANTLVVLTDVDGIYLDYGTDDQRMLEDVTAEELRAHVDDGQFPEGSMEPKVEAICRFVEGESRRERSAVVTSLDHAVDALEGDAGTRVVDARD